MLEALFFAASKPIDARELSRFPEFDEIGLVEKLVKKLNGFYAKHHRSFFIQRVGGGYQMRTVEACAPWIRQIKTGRPARFSPALLQTLAILAYKQPATRAEIEALRGVDCSHGLRRLATMEVIRIAGKSNLPGRPVTYRTTERFLEIFGLDSLEDLPRPDDADLRPEDAPADENS